MGQVCSSEKSCFSGLITVKRIKQLDDPEMQLAPVYPVTKVASSRYRSVELEKFPEKEVSNLRFRTRASPGSMITSKDYPEELSSKARSRRFERIQTKFADVDPKRDSSPRKALERIRTKFPDVETKRDSLHDVDEQVQALTRRFPYIPEAQVRAALENADGHAGKAARTLSGRDAASMRVSSPGYSRFLGVRSSALSPERPSKSPPESSVNKPARRIEWSPPRSRATMQDIKDVTKNSKATSFTRSGMYADKLAGA